MYAVIKTGGKQYRVAQGQKLAVELIDGEVGGEISLAEVLMIGEGEAVRVGTPFIAGASVSARIVAHGKGDKVHIFKMRRRKHYKKSQGHRQNFTELEITAING